MRERNGKNAVVFEDLIETILAVSAALSPSLIVDSSSLLVLLCDKGFLLANFLLLVGTLLRLVLFFGLSVSLVEIA